MYRQLSVAVLSLCLFIPRSFAADAVTRQEGFTILWESILRPVEQTRTRIKPFTDVPASSSFAPEINYAKHRGILEDVEETFRGSEPLYTEDALLWLLRSRNVEYVTDVTLEMLPALLRKYKLEKFLEGDTVVHRTLTRDELVTLQLEFDKYLRERPLEISFYSEKFHGKGTASGEPFDMYALTAAHKMYPFNTLVRVTNIENGKSVVVRINDRGPFVENRHMDLSLAAFLEITERGKGKIMATLDRLGDVSMVEPQESFTPSTPRDPCRDTKQMQKRIGQGVVLQKGIPKVLTLGSSLELAASKPFTVLTVRHPDGTINELKNLIEPEETYSLIPTAEGKYVFTLSAKEGMKRRLVMQVGRCA